MKLGRFLLIAGIAAALGFGTPGARAQDDALVASGAGTAGDLAFAFATAHPWTILPAPATPCPPEPIGCIFNSPGSLTVVEADGTLITGVIVCADRAPDHVYLDVRDADGGHHTAYASESEPPNGDVSTFGFAANTPNGCWDPEAQQAASQTAETVSGVLVLQGPCVHTYDPPGPVITNACVPDLLP